MFKSNLSKGRIAATARRGPPVQLDFESYDTRDKSNKSAKNGIDARVESVEMSSQNPRPTFQKSANRQNSNSKDKRQYANSQDVHCNENHLEMANLLSRQWKKVEDGRNPNKDGESLYELYREKDSKSLGNFEPFDLEHYWGKKILGSIRKQAS